MTNLIINSLVRGDFTPTDPIPHPEKIVVLNLLLNAISKNAKEETQEKSLQTLLNNALTLVDEVSHPLPNWINRTVRFDSEVLELLTEAGREGCFDVYAALLRIHRTELNYRSFIVSNMPASLFNALQVTNHHLNKYSSKEYSHLINLSPQDISDKAEGFGYCFWDYSEVIKASQCGLNDVAQIMVAKMHTLKVLEEMIAKHLASSSSLTVSLREYRKVSFELRNRMFEWQNITASNLLDKDGCPLPYKKHLTEN